MVISRQTLRIKGIFFHVWARVSIKCNEYIGQHFQTKKIRSRQWDPLSPILVKIVVDMLSVMIEWAKIVDQIEGAVPHLVDGVLCILQNVNDTHLHG